MNSHDPQAHMPDLRKYPQYLRRPQASAYLEEVWGLEFSPGTLAKLCCLGTGPATQYDGRRAYHTPEALDAFARSRIKPSRSKAGSAPVEAPAP